MVTFIVIALIFTVFFVGIFILPSRKQPVFKMRCDVCGMKNRDWKIVPIGHADFAWQHNCNLSENKDE